MMCGRRYSNGLHQALEAKEGLEIRPENATLASINFQTLFNLYEKISGMTGTAATEAEEFLKVYGLQIAVIPTNQPIRRIDEPDAIYKTNESKINAVIDEIRNIQPTQQPILLGTSNVQQSQLFSDALRIAF